MTTQEDEKDDIVVLKADQAATFLRELRFLNSKVVSEFKDANFGEISKTFGLLLQKYNESSGEIKNLIDGKTSFFKKATDELFAFDGLLADKVRNMNEAIALIHQADNKALDLISHINIDELPKKVEKKLHEALVVLENNFAIETKDQVRSLRTLATELKTYIEQVKTIALENRIKFENSNSKVMSAFEQRQSEFFEKLKTYEEAQNQKRAAEHKLTLENSTQILKNIENATKAFNNLAHAKTWSSIMSGFLPGLFLGATISFFVFLFSTPIFKAIIQAVK